MQGNSGQIHHARPADDQVVDGVPMDEEDMIHDGGGLADIQIFLIASTVVVVGAAVGVVVASLADITAEPSTQPPKVPPHSRKVDFDDYTQAATECFDSTKQLYQVVDRYVSLHETVKNMSEDEYNLTRPQSVAARDEIASVYGWPIGEFCVSKLTNFSRVFSPLRGDASLIHFNEDISGWNTSAVEDMTELFRESRSFNQSLISWNTSRATSLAGTFHACIAFDQDLSLWDVSSVMDMGRTFMQASFFDQPMGAWDTGKVESMTSMFEHSSSFDQDLSAWDVRRVISMRRMFSWAKRFNQDVSHWQLDSVADMRRMFYQARSFYQRSTCDWGLKLSRRFNESTMKNLKNLTIESRFSDVFRNSYCESYQDPEPHYWPLTQYCGFCAAYYSERTERSRSSDVRVPASLPLESPSKLQEAVDRYMRYRLGLDYIHNVSKHRDELAARYGWPIGSWNVSSIDDFSDVFSFHRNSVTAVFNEDVSDWEVSNGSSFKFMFAGASLFNQSLSAWDVASAMDLSGMFGGPRPDANVSGAVYTHLGAASFDQDLSLWNVSRVTAMASMFQGATLFDQDLSKWDTSEVETMEAMFLYARAFKSDLPWDVSRVRSFKYMFARTNYVSDVTTWDVSSGMDFVGMFTGLRTFNQDLTRWNVSSATTVVRQSCAQASTNDRDPHSILSGFNVCQCRLQRRHIGMGSDKVHGLLIDVSPCSI